MTDHDGPSDQDETPRDVATLFSWANLHGAKYRDFSASRAQTREKARQRVQDAIDADHRQVHEETEAAMTAESRNGAAAMRRAEPPAPQSWRDAERNPQSAARQRELAAQQSVEQAAQQAAARLAAIAAQQAVRQAAQEAAQQRSWPPPEPEIFSDHSAASPEPAAAPFDPPLPRPFDRPCREQPQTHRLPPDQPQSAPVREQSYSPSRLPGPPADPQDNGRPAWLRQDRPETPSQPVPPAPLPKLPDDVLQSSRDRMTSRWFALRNVFEPAHPPVEPAPAPAQARAPVIAVFSLAGGVGKTSLVATLGRALSARGERVLMVDTAPFGLLPFFFGARDQRPGVLRTFSPPGASSEAPVQIVTIDPETLSPEATGQEPLVAEIAKFSRGVSRILVDLATASGATTRRVIHMAPLVLVPVVPDMNSVVSVSSIDIFFQNNPNVPGKPELPFYVLNQFDPSLPLHLDVREVLREQLGDRLLPFALRRAPAVSEALAEGMTVMDYAPNSSVSEDFANLAGWVKNLSAPANTTYRGVRWSER